MNSVPLSVTKILVVRILLSSVHRVLCKRNKRTMWYWVKCYIMCKCVNNYHNVGVSSDEGEIGPLVSNEIR